MYSFYNCRHDRQNAKKYKERFHFQNYNLTQNTHYYQGTTHSISL